MARPVYPSDKLAAAVPGRFQVRLASYVKLGRYFRPVPKHAVYVELQSVAEARRFWARIEAAVEAAVAELEESRAGVPGDARSDGSRNVAV